MSKISAPRDGFSSGFGVLAATLGSAVGLGNIWKFPYETGSSGGAGFLLVYLLSTVLVALPLMIAEISIGRSGRTDPVGVYLRLAPRTLWWLIGAIGLVSATLIIAFYSDVVGWVFAYVAKSIGGSVLTDDRQALKDTFSALIANPQAALLWQGAVLALVGLILAFGVSKGIEAVTKKLMPALLILLVGVAATSLSLPGAMKGVAFLLVPDFAKINGDVVLKALGLAFFKLSLGIGSMTIYGSYFGEKQNILKTATIVMLADLTVSMLAGLAIFPAVFALGFDPAGGPALLFQIIPAVFAKMPAGHLLLVAFFILTAFAAIGALLSLAEVPVAVLHERLGWSRPLSAFITTLIMMAFGALAALSFSTLAHVSLFGHNLFEAFDFLSSKILMPVTGLLTSLFVSLAWGVKAFRAAGSNDGTLKNERLLTWVYAMLAFVSPLLIIVIMVVGLM